MTLPESVLKRAEEWTLSPYDEDCRNEIKTLIKNKNEKEINERFAVELEFGTGGLRGLIRNGTNGMNKYVIARATRPGALGRESPPRQRGGAPYRR